MVSPQDPLSRPTRLAQVALPAFDLPGVPRSVNQRLTTFFSATEPRRRIYQLLLSLLRHHSLRSANAIAFDLFLALVPMLGLAGWAVSRILSRDSAAMVSSSLVLDVTPHQFRAFIQDNLLTLSATSVAPFATIAGWWLSSSAFFTLISVFEESFECIPRPYWKTTLLSMGFAFSGFVILAASGAAGVFFTIERFGRVRSLVDAITESGLLRAGIALAAYFVISGYFAFVYRYAIARSVSRRRVWPGAFFAAGAGSAASVLFGYYASHISSYTLFYGGLAAVAVALLWLWLWCTAMLIGAELNIALEDLTDLRGSKSRLSRGPQPESS